MIETSQQRIRLRSPDDFHVHLREGKLLQNVLGYTASNFSRAVAMPNLTIPVSTRDSVRRYKREIYANLDKKHYPFQVLVPSFVSSEIELQDLREAFINDDFFALKWYPANSTTNSSGGISDWRDMKDILSLACDLGKSLMIHCEVGDTNILSFARERQFITDILRPLMREYRELSIIFEHVSSAAGVDFVLDAEHRIAATVTPHHMLLSYKDLFTEKGLVVDNYCHPVLKSEKDRCRIVEASLFSEKFFAGTDSAPHVKSRKRGDYALPGIFSAVDALSIYTSVFEEMGKLDKLEEFLSVRGAKFHSLPLNDTFIELKKNTHPLPTKQKEIGGVRTIRLPDKYELFWEVVSSKVR